MTPDRARIALIDDDPVWADTLAEYLGEKGFATQAAPDGRRGLELLERGGFAVAVVDLHMPGLDGLELVRQVRACRLPVRVILVSNDDDPFLPGRLREDGVPFLSKAAVPRLLVRAIDQALRELDDDQAERRARAPWNRLLTAPGADRGKR